MPPELRLDGRYVLSMPEAGKGDGGRRKKHKNPIARTAVRTVVTALLVLRFAFIVYKCQSE